MANEYALKEHRWQYPVLFTIGDLLRPIGWCHEGNFSSDAATYDSDDFESRSGKSLWFLRDSITGTKDSRHAFMGSSLRPVRGRYSDVEDNLPQGRVQRAQTNIDPSGQALALLN